MIYHIINIERAPASTFRPELPQGDGRTSSPRDGQDTGAALPDLGRVRGTIRGIFGAGGTGQNEILDTEKFDTLCAAWCSFKNFSDVELWEVLRLSLWSKVPESEYILRDGEERRGAFLLTYWRRGWCG